MDNEGCEFDKRFHSCGDLLLWKLQKYESLTAGQAYFPALLEWFLSFIRTNTGT